MEAAGEETKLFMKIDFLLSQPSTILSFRRSFVNI